MLKMSSISDLKKPTALKNTGQFKDYSVDHPPSRPTDYPKEAAIFTSTGKRDTRCLPAPPTFITVWKRAAIFFLPTSLTQSFFSFLHHSSSASSRSYNRRRRHATHARACCENFCGCSTGEVAEILEMFDAFRPTTPKCLCLLEFCLSIFVVSCSSLKEVRQCRIQ